MWVDDPGGHYQVSLGCNHSAAAIRSDDNDPRGMSVDPRTGVVTATPQREGAYRDVALVATDGGNNSVVVVVWSFNVTARAADSPWQNVALEASLGCGNFDVIVDHVIVDHVSQISSSMPPRTIRTCRGVLSTLGPC